MRGLLCDDCNIALGKMKDNIETLQNAIDYLKEKR
ncbi:endonuclease domain-containing protein [Escherichia coli]